MNETRDDIHPLMPPGLKCTLCQARSPEGRGKLVDKAGTQGILPVGMKVISAAELNA